MANQFFMIKGEYFMKKQLLIIGLAISSIATNAYAGYAYISNLTTSNCRVTLHNGLNGDMAWTEDIIPAYFPDKGQSLGPQTRIGDYGAGIKEIHAIAIDGPLANRPLENKQDTLVVNVPAGSSANNVYIEDVNGQLKLKMNG
jgi:hypothetical protein